MLMSYRQSLVLQEGDGPHAVTVLHNDGTATRMEVSAVRDGLQVRITTLAEGKTVDMQGWPV